MKSIMKHKMHKLHRIFTFVMAMAITLTALPITGVYGATERRSSRPQDNSAGEIKVVNGSDTFYYAAKHLLEVAFESLDGDKIYLAEDGEYILADNNEFTQYGANGTVSGMIASYGLYFNGPKTVEIIGANSTIVNGKPTTLNTVNGSATVVGFKNIITTTNKANVILSGVTLDAGVDKSTYLINAATGVVTVDDVKLTNVDQCLNPVGMTTQPADIAGPTPTKPEIIIEAGGLDITGLAEGQALFSASISSSFNTTLGLAAVNLPTATIVDGASITVAGGALSSATPLIKIDEKIMNNFRDAVSVLFTDQNTSGEPLVLVSIITPNGIVLHQGLPENYVAWTSGSDTVYFLSLADAIAVANADGSENQTIAVAGNILETKQSVITAPKLTLTSATTNPATVTFTAPKDAPVSAEMPWLYLSGTGDKITNLNLTATDSWVEGATTNPAPVTFAAPKAAPVNEPIQIEPTVVFIKANDVTISDCTITAGSGNGAMNTSGSAEYAIQVESDDTYSGIVIENNRMIGTNANGAIYVKPGASISISSNTFTGNYLKRALTIDAATNDTEVVGNTFNTTTEDPTFKCQLMFSAYAPATAVINMANNTFIGTGEVDGGYPVVLYLYDTTATVGTLSSIEDNAFLNYAPTVNPEGGTGVLGILDWYAHSTLTTEDLSGNQAGEFQGSGTVSGGTGSSLGYFFGTAYSIKGTVSGLSDNGDITIHYTTDGVASSVNTNADGTFEILCIPEGSKIVLTPSEVNGYNTPASITISKLLADSFTGNLFVYTAIPTTPTPTPAPTTPTPTPAPTPTIPTIQPAPPLPSTATQSPTPTLAPDPIPQDPVIITPPIAVSNKTPYVTGYADGTMKPNNPITRAEFAAILSNLYNDGEVLHDTTMPDVQTHWARSFVAFAEASGFVGGYPDGTFRPDQPITRAEVATVLAQVKNLSDNTDDGRLSDISNHWAKNFILALVNAGAVSGYPDGTYKPDSPITRAEMIVIINRLEQRSGFKTDKTFSDLSPDFWAYDDVMNAANGF